VPEKKGRIRALWQRATATWWTRLTWASAALVIAAAIVGTVLLLSAPPRPDATLHPTPAEADDQVRRLAVEEAPWLQIDASTLHAYGSYLGLEIWSGTDTFHSPCLMAVNRANNTLSEARCAPTPAELVLDVASFGDDYEGLPGEGIVRFILRGDTVDAYVYIMPGTD
jgi:hypothetical protein